jgi:16S rRNA (uracil1498-N3)-methyltransferase
VSAPHFFVDTVEMGTVRLTQEDTRHALRSLRLRPGETVTVADGRGAVGTGTLSGEEDGHALLDIESVSRVVRRGTLVCVAFAPPKGDRLGWAVQKLAELGVDEAVLMQTERSVRAWPAERAERALERQGAVAREAAMQARLPFVLEVHAAPSVDDVLSSRASLVMLGQSGDASLHDVLDPDATAVRILVGPEGGWTDGEVQAARDAGAAVVSLGSPVLRTETAAVVGATLVLARYGRLG